jgi:L-fucose dehydrogenase
LTYKLPRSDLDTNLKNLETLCLCGLKIMNLGLKEKVIIVSGGAKGIGEGISNSLAIEGAYVAIVGRNHEDNQKAIDKIQAAGGQAWSFVAELSEPNECEKAVNEVVKKFGRIDGLVNNAGVNHSNLIHYYLLAHHALPYLKQSKGPIVNIGSKVADTGQGGTSAYAASNGGRNALTREWAVELLKYGIRVNAVIVAECYTPLYDKWIKTLPNPEETLAKIYDKIPLGKRMTTAEEIADMVVFLMSKRSSHTTGQIIYVDGGYTHLDRALI